MSFNIFVSSSTSVLVIPSSDLPIFEEVRIFNIEELNTQEVENVDFLALKYEMLVSPPFNIPVRHAVKLLNLIKEIQEGPLKKYIHVIVEQPVTASVKNISNILVQCSSDSVSTSPLLMFIKTVISNLELQAKNSEVIVHFIKKFSRTESKSIDFNPLQRDLAKMRLKGYLGVGSSSSVYKINWENTSSAIKVFNSGYNPSNEVRALQYLNKVIPAL
ncbi:hypothetical protein F8M41_025443 [Gigaspora margarita]|uniref:Uncharacterized protein n=1 Tax=Gigaspora margarita TaxID=4874 RepID=A0A8H3XIP4_GIGMA|nr:hypothetical protein F8M41_025443 [Gigaspora margarita]